MRFLLIVCFLMILFQCTSDYPDNVVNNSKFEYSGGQRELPLITGINRTTVMNPDGTGDVYGIPSYPMPNVDNKYESINVVPNPYIFANSWEPSDPYSTSDNVSALHFIHLPSYVKINIVRGLCNNERNGAQIISGGTGIIDYSEDGCFCGGEYLLKNVIPERILIHETISDDGTEIWDMKDENGILIKSGCYRAFFISKSNKVINWIDIYIISKIDGCVWIDPTGWLGENYKYIQIDSENGVQYKSICDFYQF